MSGRWIVIGLLLFVALFGGGLWYAQVYAYYERTDGKSVVDVGIRPIVVSDYVGVDAESSPLKLRGCFRIAPEELAGAPPADDPAPLIAPFWFDCFDAEAIGADLEAGRAHAVIAAEDEPEGFDRIIAVYPDGRAYEWRQLREE